MGYSIDPISADCYEGTTCLINKLGITDERKLSQIETLITTDKCNDLVYCRGGSTNHRTKTDVILRQ